MHAANVCLEQTACWIFDWLFLLDAYDKSFFNDKIYPLTFAWRERYVAAIEAAKKSAPQPTELAGPDAVSKVLGSSFQDSDSALKVEADPEGLKRGDEVEMWPLDTGFNAKDAGRLVKLDTNEAVVQAKSEQGGTEVRIHYPRWNFGIQRAGEGKQQANGGDGEFVTLN